MGTVQKGRLRQFVEPEEIPRVVAVVLEVVHASRKT